MVKRKITRNDSTIFGSLYRAGRPLPIKKIATRTNISWPTVRNSVVKLEKFGVVNTQKSVRRTNVTIDPKFLRTLIAKLPKTRRRTGQPW